MAKVRIGLVSENRNIEADIQEASKQFGGAFISHSKNILELSQKLGMQKVQMILMVWPSSTDIAEFGRIYQFIRGKRDLQNVPLCLLTEAPEWDVPFLITDTSVRAFPLQGGVFMALLCMSPLLESNRPPEGAIDETWIQKEFLDSLKAKVGQEIDFKITSATDDELHAAFFCQQSEEIRTHLGWFKFNARLLESQGDGMAQLFQGMSRDMIEQVAESLVGNVIEEFKTKVKQDLAPRGVIYLPEIEKVSPTERKWLYSQGRHSGFLFSATQCQVLLQISKYI